MNDIHILWRTFDRATAWGCAQRNQPFDLERCRQAWYTYERALCTKYNWEEWFGARPLGI